MKTTRKTIIVKEVFDGYKDMDWDGVVGYGGKLDIRPEYQREFIYDTEKERAVIGTILKERPLNIMYWVKNGEKYELLDGQQRTLSICRFLDHKYTIIDALGQKQYEDSIFDEEKERILNYPLEICICEGTESEILDWFKTINIKGAELNEQEALNATHTGPWLTDAKRYFSKPNCAAYGLGKDYVNGAVERQDYLKVVLGWINNGDVQGYMVDHRFDENAQELWQYFQAVIGWIRSTFLEYRKEMKGVDWGRLYNEFKDDNLDSAKIAELVNKLMADEEVQNKKGIYEYVLLEGRGDLDDFRRSRLLNLRQFEDSVKRTKYEQQQGICPDCGKHFEYEQMQGDHIEPWSKGGKTVPENCQMLCNTCNLRKSSKS